MGALGDMLLKDSFMEKKHRKKIKKIEYSTNKLRDLGVDFVQRDLGDNLIIFGMNTYDFHPSTGKYKARNCKEWKKGLNNLIKDMGVSK